MNIFGSCFPCLFNNHKKTGKVGRKRSVVLKFPDQAQTAALERVKTKIQSALAKATKKYQVNLVAPNVTTTQNGNIRIQFVDQGSKLDKFLRPDGQAALSALNDDSIFTVQKEPDGKYKLKITKKGIAGEILFPLVEKKYGAVQEFTGLGLKLTNHIKLAEYELEINQKIKIASPHPLMEVSVKSIEGDRFKLTAGDNSIEVELGMNPEFSIEGDSLIVKNTDGFNSTRYELNLEEINGFDA